MKSTIINLRHWLAALSLGAVLATHARADVTLTATSPAGGTVIQSGGTFDIDLTWSGTPPVAATDYAVTLNTTQLVLTGRDFNAGLSPYVDTPYLPPLPVSGANRFDVTWFKSGGFTGKDVTLHFQVPANYTGPATLNVGLAVDGVQDASAAAIPFTVAGTTVNLQPIGPVTGTNTTTAVQTKKWSELVWTGATPNGNGDIANFVFGNTQTITLDVPVTLGRLDCTGTGHYSLLREGSNTLTFDNTSMGEVASLLFTRSPNDALGRRLDSDLVLNSDWVATWARVQGGAGRIHGLRGIISGAGRASLNYAIAPTEGPDTGTSINLNGTTATAAHVINLGLAGDAANTYTGGTDLRAGNSVFGTVKFLANKVNALGSPATAGRLFMHQAALDLGNFDQTVGGLGGGPGSSKISSTSTATGTTTLDIQFGSDKGPFSFSGVIMDGGSTGASGALRTVAVSKAGTGIQTLTGAQTYSGPTAITGGSLLVNGSLAAGSAVTVSSGGTLGGTGTVNGPILNQGNIAPGVSVGSLSTGALTLDQNSSLAIEFADWAGSVPGTAWDHLNCTSLTLAGTPDEHIGIKLLPFNLANFAETAKTFVIATSAATISGFDATAIMIDDSAMPGNGTWGVQLDGDGKQLQLVYATDGSTPSAYNTWTTAKGLTAANQAPGLDPDHDGHNNLAEFAFNGDPLSGSDNGLFFTARADTALDPDGDPEFVFTCAVRRGAVFAANANHAQISAAIDGVIYTVEGSADLTTPWGANIGNLGAADTPPAASDLPDLTGSAWEYRTFSAFNGLPGKGFMRAVATSAP